jgi:hypothetical protein
MTRRASAAAITILLLGLPGTIHAQMNMRTTPPPLATAENEGWYLRGDPVMFAGDIYYPAGAQVYFNVNEMIRSGNFLGIPLYTRTTIEPYSIVYVPVGHSLMQPYERRRTGEVAGTAASSAPSFPIDRGIEATTGDIPPHAAAPPTVGSPILDWAPEAAARPEYPEPATMLGRTQPPPHWGSLRTAQLPTGLNAVFITYENRRWFEAGAAVEYDDSQFTRVGEYHGFPVFRRNGGDASILYVPVASDARALVTPYKQR